MSQSAPVLVHLQPSWVPPNALRGGVAVVLDVLRATTVIVQALAAGCREVHPVAELAEARRLASAFPPDTVLLAGERHGLPIPSFDLGNSPDEFTPERCQGRTLVMTTTNGTRAVLACLEAEVVWVAAFTNRSAVLAALRGVSRPIHLVCSGTEGEVSLEDVLLAGALVEGLGHDVTSLDDSALIARDAWRALRGGEGPEALARALARGRGGRRVQEIGRAADIAAAARPDFHATILPQVLRDPVRIVRAAPGPFLT